MSETWLLLDSGPGDPAFNMALDATLLESVFQIGRPVLRFYGWTQSAATFGYFQKYSEVEAATLLRPLIRRPTGGGIVPHNADWTYSVVIPAGHEWHGMKARQSYQRVHEWICNAFKHLRITTQLAQDARKPESGECFIGHEVHDLLWEGHKIAGAAQRRTRAGLLIQGSIQPPPLHLDRFRWQEAMCQAAGPDWGQFPVDSGLLSRARGLAVEVYATAAFNRRR